MLVQLVISRDTYTAKVIGLVRGFIGERVAESTVEWLKAHVSKLQHRYGCRYSAIVQIITITPLSLVGTVAHTRQQ